MMSRTVRGNRGPGSEYWSRRAGPRFQLPGAESKVLTHHAERREGKATIAEQLAEDAQFRQAEAEKLHQYYLDHY
jgi:hypothetical protein